MTATVFRLLPADEQAILKAYVEGTAEPDDAAFAAFEIPEEAQPSRLEVAVAQILLSRIQDSLPQWSAMRDDELIVNRKEHKRHKDARLNFSPKLICIINWADSGPGFSWPEAYYVTYLPGFNKFVITSSRDGDDTWGCADHAIGVADGSLDPVEAAKDIIIEFWRSQYGDWEQSRWAYLFDTGLIGSKTANEWADAVWCDEEAVVDEEDEDVEVA